MVQSNKKFKKSSRDAFKEKLIIKIGNQLNLKETEIEAYLVKLLFTGINFPDVVRRQ